MKIKHSVGAATLRLQHFHSYFHYEKEKVLNGEYAYENKVRVKGSAEVKG